jgi:hypothetical protein
VIKRRSSLRAGSPSATEPFVDKRYLVALFTTPKPSCMASISFRCCFPIGARSRSAWWLVISVTTAQAILSGIADRPWKAGGEEARFLPVKISNGDFFFLHFPDKALPVLGITKHPW